MGNPMDVWGKLWDIATAEEGDPARIEVSQEEADYVVLHWLDGSKASFEWFDGDWQRIEPGELCPSDAAARGSI